MLTGWRTASGWTRRSTRGGGERREAQGREHDFDAVALDVCAHVGYSVLMNETTKPAAIEILRAMYRAVRAGATLDVPAYIDALLDVVADGGDVMAIERAFERLGYWTRLDILGSAEGAGVRCRAALDARGWRGAIRVASALGLRDVWAAAMTAHYGPTGTHASRLGVDGVPTVETMAEFPRIGEAMAEAAERFDSLVAWYDRQNAGKAPELHYVVRYSAPSAPAKVA
jgi:hypothetical protein